MLRRVLVILSVAVAAMVPRFLRRRRKFSAEDQAVIDKSLARRERRDR
jgi:hypothetical protein